MKTTGMIKWVRCLVGIALLSAWTQTSDAQGTGGWCYVNDYPDPGPSKIKQNCTDEGTVCPGNCVKTVPTIPPGTVCETCIQTINISKQCFSGGSSSVSALDYYAGCLAGFWSCYCDTFTSVPGGPPHAAPCGNVSHGTTPLTKSDAC